MATIVDNRVPPLAAGDRLTREEFLRRWEAHPEIKNAELIKGIVYIASPVSVEHGDMHGDAGGWLGVYKAATPGTASGRNTTLLLLNESFQPDLNLRLVPECGGGSWVEDKYLHGTPELIAEICRSSVSYDLHVKLEAYLAAKVPEYLAVLHYEQEIRWHTLVNGEYELLAPGPDGLFRSPTFPGLWLDGQALLAGELGRVLARVQEGLASAEHQQFVAELAARKDTPRQG